MGNSMLQQCFLREGVVYVPTTGKVDVGLYRGIEPVAVVPVADNDALRNALRETFARGNPPLPNLPRENRPLPATLRHAGLKTWRAFARGGSTWTVRQRDGIYSIAGHKKSTDGNWVEDPDQLETFMAGTESDAVIERLIAIMQKVAQAA